MSGPVEVRSPADGSVLGEIDELDPSQAEELVGRARSAYATWRDVPPHARAEILHRAADALAGETEELGLLHARESGKVIAQARKEVAGAAALLHANAEVGRLQHGQVAPSGGLRGGERDLTIIERVPLGVVVCVIPFNFPVELTIEKAGAALAAGNTVVLKPPPQNPLATMRVAELLIEAGLPEGALVVAPGGRELSAALCRAPGVDAVSLTGSVAAGLAVSQATAHLLRPLHLELGGNGAALVLRDADLDLVVDEVIKGRLLMNGQACAATKRVIATTEVADELAERLQARIGKIAVGDPTLDDTVVGPLIDASAAAKVSQQVARTVADGARPLVGAGEADGAWFPPVLLDSVPSTTGIVADDEVFGPVFPLVRVEDAEEAIRVAHATRLRLTAAVFSSDIAAAMGVAERLDFGGVVVNGTNNYRPPIVPFGGVDLGGSGREGIGYAYEELTRTRFIALRGIRRGGPGWDSGRDGG